MMRSAFVVLFFAAIAAAQTSPLTGEIRVAVRVEGTGEPIPGVEVSVKPSQCGDCLVDLPDNEEDLLAFLRELAAARGIVPEGVQVRNGSVAPSPKPSMPATVITDEAGNATFPAAELGVYEIAARRSGYMGVHFVESVRVLQAESSVRVTLSGATSDGLLYMTPTAVIRGHVRDSNGVPVADASVGLVLVLERDGRRTLGAPAGMVNTNAAGEYILTAEQLGDFLLRIPRTSSGIMSFSYYPASTDVENAKRITLERGMSLTDIDFELK